MGDSPSATPLPPPVRLPLASAAHAPAAAPLPVPLTEFIERPQVIVALRGLISDPGVRLVTLTGPGGAGKTRLALRIAAELEAAFTSSIAFVPLAAVSDPTLVPATIALALSLALGDEQRIIAGLKARIHGGSLLLVLDNFEHVVPAAPLITRWLTACPGLTVLTTSRAPLRLAGEHVFVVPPMSQATPKQSTAAEVLEAEAVRLFVARATSATSEFTLSDENAGDVAELCRRLEGIPLAIELAAARVPSLPPRSLLDRLEPRLPLLRGGPHDAPDRLRSMRDAIAWSYDLLSPDEQRLFRRLAIFAGGCTLAAAEAVGGSANLLDELAALVSGNLVQMQVRRRREPRYVMLESMREFGLEQFAASGDEAAARAAHAAYYLDLAERAWPHWSAPAAPEWTAIFRADQDNLRAALTWLARTKDRRRAIRLIGALWPYWDRQEQRGEGLPWLRQALVWSAGSHTRERIRVLNGAATLNCALIAAYDPAGAAWSEESLAIADEIGDAEGALQALSNIASDALLQGDVDRATRLTDAGLDRIRALGAALPHVALAEVDRLGFLGFIALEQHEDVRAERLISEAHARKRALGYRAGEATESLLLAVLAYRRGDLPLAIARCQEGLPDALESGGRQTMLFLLDRLAIIAGEVAEAADAARLGGTVERLHELLTTTPNAAEQADRDRAVAAARTRLGEDAFASAWAEGRRLRLEDAVAIGRAITPSAELLAPVHHRRLAAKNALLSTREREVLGLMADGQTDQAIADLLYLSRRTVNTHVAHILTKLDVATRREAVTRATALGLLPSDHSPR